MAFDVTSRIKVQMEERGADAVRSKIDGVGKSVGEMSGRAEFANRIFTGLLVGASGAAAVALAGVIKGAIDSAEALHDMAIQTGASVESLSAMIQLGRMTGTSGEAIAGAMNKLAKGLAATGEEGSGVSRALQAVGLDFEKFKALKPEDQLVTLAKAMAGFEDGSGKSAVAMQLMGREGAKLLPFMKDLAETGKLVATVTTAQAEMADRYNDALEASRLRVEAMTRGVALGLLPALISVHDMTGEYVGILGNLLKGSSEVTSSFDAQRAAVVSLGTVFEALVIFGSDVAFTFKAIGREIGAYLAAMDSMAKLDVRGALAIATTRHRDALNDRADLDAFQESVLGVQRRMLQMQDIQKESARLAKLFGASLDDAGTKATQGQAKFSSATEKSKRVVEAHNTAMDDAVAAYRKAEIAGIAVGHSIEQRNLIAMQELVLGRDLTTSETQLIELAEKLADGTWVLTEAQRESYRASVARGQAMRDEKAYLLETAKANDQTFDAIVNRTASLEQEVVAQERSNREALLGTAALRELEVSKLRDQAVTADRNADIAASWDLEGKVTAEYRQQAAELRRLADLKQQGIHIQMAVDSAAEWKRTTDSIENGLTDALMRAFERGEGFADAFKQTLVNAFKTMVLEPTVRGLVQTGGSYIGAALGYGGGGGAYSMANNASNLYSLGSYAAGGIWGSNAAYGAAIGTTNIGAGSQAAMLAAQTGEFGFAGTAATSSAAAGAGSGAASWMSALGPYAIVALALLAMFGDFSKWSLGSVAGGSFDGEGGFGLNKNDLPFDFGNNPEHDRPAALESLISSIGGTIGDTAKRFGGSASGLGLSIATDRDREGQAAGIIALIRDGQRLSGVQTGTGAFIDTDPRLGDHLGLEGDAGPDFSPGAAGKIGADKLGAWFQESMPIVIVQALQQSDLTARFKTYFDGIAPDALTSEKASQMLQVSSAVQSLTEAFTPLGGVFLQFAGISVDTFQALAQAAGGFDALGQSVSGYFKNYYTDAERAALQTNAVRDALAAVGVQMPETRESFRALVDAQDLTTESGRETFNVLMRMQGAFADLVPAAAAAADAVTDTVDTITEAATTGQPTSMRDFYASAKSRYDDQRWSAGTQQEYLRLAATQGSNIWNWINKQGIDATLAPANAGWQFAGDKAIPGATFQAGLTYYMMQKSASDLAAIQGNSTRPAAPGGGAEPGDNGFAQEQLRLQQQQLDETRRLIAGFDSVEAALMSFRDSLFVGDLSALSPEQQYLRQKQLVDDLERQALGSGAEDIGGAAQAYREASQLLLQLSKGVNASGSAFAADNADVVDGLDRIVDRLEALETHAAAQVRVSQGYGQETVEQLTEQNRLAAEASVNAAFARQSGG